MDCKFFLVRYVPDLVSGESLNIGVLLHCPERSYAWCLFTNHLGRIRRFHPQVDEEFFAGLQEYFERQIEDHRNDLDGLLHEIQNYSNMVEISRPRECLTLEPEAEIARLFDQFVK